jgi:hypothetical protein
VLAGDVNLRSTQNSVTNGRNLSSLDVHGQQLP